MLYTINEYVTYRNYYYKYVRNANKMKNLNYTEWLIEGKQYQKAGSSFTKKFTPVIAYNILSMSLESYCMAIMDKHHYLPENHTFYDLIDGLEKVISLDKSLKDRILELAQYQEICSIAAFKIASPNEFAIEKFRAVIEDVAKLAHLECA